MQSTDGVVINLDLVTVIVPSFNHANYVYDCLLSIYKQSYTFIELIVIDDGSTDQSEIVIKQFVEKFSSRFHKVISFSQTNQGIVKTINRAIRLSHGEYVIVIASDDIAEPDLISELHRQLDAHPEAVLAMPDNILIDEKGKRIGWDIERNITSLDASFFYTFGDYLGLTLWGNKTKLISDYKIFLRNNPVSNGCLIRRYELLKVGCFREDMIPEDWYIHLQLIKLGPFLYIPSHLFQYRWHKRNTVKSRKYLLDWRKNFLNLLKNEREYCVEHGLYHYWVASFYSKQNHSSKFCTSINKLSYVILSFEHYFQVLVKIVYIYIRNIFWRIKSKKY